MNRHFTISLNILNDSHNAVADLVNLDLQFTIMIQNECSTRSIPMLMLQRIIQDIGSKRDNKRFTSPNCIKLMQDNIFRSGDVSRDWGSKVSFDRALG